MTISTSSDAGGSQLKGGCFSADIEVISGLPSEASAPIDLPNLNDMICGDTVFMSEPFVFALND